MSAKKMMVKKPKDEGDPKNVSELNFGHATPKPAPQHLPRIAPRL